MKKLLFAALLCVSASSFANTIKVDSVDSDTVYLQEYEYVMMGIVLIHHLSLQCKSGMVYYVGKQYVDHANKNKTIRTQFIGQYLGEGDAIYTPYFKYCKKIGK